MEVRELRTTHPRKGRATKISSETTKILQRDGSAPKRARRHRVVNCASPAVSSFARSGQKLVETGRRDFPERPRCRCVAEPFLITYHGARKCGFDTKPGPKRTSCSGRAQQGFVRDAITCSVITPPSCIVFLSGRLRAPWTPNSGQRRI